MQKDSKIFVAGHHGLVGSAIVRNLENHGYKNLVLRSRKETDLTNSAAVAKLFETESPEYVFLAAAKVGGILANSSYPADFIRDNLAIQLNVIDAAYKNGVESSSSWVLVYLSQICAAAHERRIPADGRA